ncbi:hypothetical protein MASR2M41_08160 [Flammeovirgaceae bacterium]
MNNILEDLRSMLTKSDLEKITEILNKRHESPNNVDEVRDQIIEGPSKEVADVTKYYLALKKFEEKVIEKMISNNTPLDLRHWEGTIKPALQEISDPHIQALNNDAWYVDYVRTSKELGEKLKA